MKILKTLTFIFLFSSFFASCQSEFNQEVWLQEPNNNILTKNNPRMEMTSDLTTNYLKIGMRKSEVIDLLGEPTRTQMKNVLIKGRKLPDSLSMNNILERNREDQNRLIEDLNNWYETNGIMTPTIFYQVGWTLMDPVSLEIYLDEGDLVKDFEVVQN